MGVFAKSNCTITIRDCLFENNNGAMFVGGDADAETRALLLRENTFKKNNHTFSDEHMYKEYTGVRVQPWRHGVL